jgi:hypothetical protein
VLWHTHSCQDPSPSQEDLLFTRRMVDAGQALGVGLLDHLILSSTGRWVSLRHRGFAGVDEIRARVRPPGRISVTNSPGIPP